MTDTIDITPSPRILRMLGNIDFSAFQCLCELIDNSIDGLILRRPTSKNLEFMSKSLR